MRILFKNAVISLALCTMSISAGGKTVTPVDVAIIPIKKTTTISPIYLAIGATAARFSSCDNSCDYEDITYGATLRAGYDFNPYIGIELRAMRTFLDEGPFGGVPLQNMGLFAKPQYPLGESINLYGLVGYGYTENLGNEGRLNYFNKDDGFSAGLGIEYDLSNREGDREENANYNRPFDGYADQGKGWSLFLDYQRLLIKSDVPDMDVASFGVRYDF